MAMTCPAYNNDSMRYCQTLGALARWALEQEALLTPKPGLVDRKNCGSHQDLTLALMRQSAEILEPYFVLMAVRGWRQPLTRQLREDIGRIGREAEAAMLEATGGVNTHRGAIWALGLLVTIAAHDVLYTNAILCDKNTTFYKSITTTSDKNMTICNSIAAFCNKTAELASIEDRYIPKRFSNGQKASRQYNTGGAKSQAQQGFPVIKNHALPTLKRSRQLGLSVDDCRLNTLLAIMAHLDDTCMLSRAGEAGLKLLQQRSLQILELGGVSVPKGLQALHKLDQAMIAINASPGGCADLLAATMLIDRLQSAEFNRGETALWSS